MIDLYWKTSKDDHSRWLYAGCQDDIELAWLNKRTKWWRAVLWLPGLDPRKEFDTLENQITDVETKVQQWFALAMTDRPDGR